MKEVYGFSCYVAMVAEIECHFIHIVQPSCIKSCALSICALVLDMNVHYILCGWAQFCWILQFLFCFSKLHLGFRGGSTLFVGSGGFSDFCIGYILFTSITTVVLCFLQIMAENTIVAKAIDGVARAAKDGAISLVI